MSAFPKRLPLLLPGISGSQAAIPASVTASFVSEKILMDSVAYWNIQAKWNTGGGTLAGTLSFEGSNEPNPDETSGSADWSTLTTSPASVAVTSGAGNAMVRGGPDAFTWLRVRFTFTSGAGAMRLLYAGRGSK